MLYEVLIEIMVSHVFHLGIGSHMIILGQLVGESFQFITFYTLKYNDKCIDIKF